MATRDDDLTERAPVGAPEAPEAPEARAPADPSDGGGRGAPRAPERDPRVPRSYFRAADGTVEHDALPGELARMVREGHGTLWVDIDSTQRHQHAVLEKVFNFHPLAIEDTLNPQSRVKVEEYQGFLFAIVRGVRFNDSTNDPYDLDTFNLCFFLGPNFLVTVHGEPSPSCAAAARQLERSPDLLDRGPARLMHLIMDELVDRYFPVIDQVEEFIDGLEEKVFVNFQQDTLHTVFTVKRLVLTLRRYVGPQREVFGVLANRPSPLLPAEVQLYFRDIYDHVLRILESFDNQREVLSSTLDAYLSQVSNRLGMVTKSLSLLATLSIPFVMLSGMWGMNVEHIPLSHHAHGFAILLGLQVGLGAALLLLLRWRRWL